MDTKILNSFCAHVTDSCHLDRDCDTTGTDWVYTYLYTKGAVSTVIRLDRLFFLDHRTLSTRVNGFVAFVMPPQDHAISSPEFELSRLCGRVTPAFGSY